MNTLGERLKTVMREKNILVEDICAISGKKQPTISSYLTNRTFPNQDFFDAIINLIPDVNLHFIITGKGSVYLKNENGELATLQKELKESKSRERELTNALLKVIGGKTPVAKNKGVYVPANLMLHNNRLWFGAKHTVNYTPRFAQ